METYRPRTTPMAHQLEYLRRVAERPSYPSDADVFAPLAEMGTGKSAMILYEWQERVSQGELADLLVMAKAGCYRNWFVDKSEVQQSEITTHLDPALRERMVVAGWRSGGGKAKREELRRLLAERGRPRALFVNIEAMSTVEEAQELVGEFLSRRRAMFVIDESTTIKSNSAKRAKQVRALGRQAAARRILTGLVTPKSPLDLYAQFEFLDWRILGFKSYWAFRARYAVIKKQLIGGRTVPLVVGYRNTEELRQKIAPYSFRCLKEQCLDLPPKVYTRREVRLSDEQRRMYRELLDFSTTQWGDSHVSATVVIAVIVRLLQLLQGFVVDEEGNTHVVPEHRTEELIETLQEHDGKAIVWLAFGESGGTLHRVAQRLREEFGPRSVAEFWGGNRATRDEDERRFLGDPECRFMLSTPQAGGYGNTWTVADLVVYYGNTYDLELRRQSEDRAHRRGQTRSVTYVDLVAPDTVDEKIIKVLRSKIDLAAAIAGDGYREWLI